MGMIEGPGNGKKRISGEHKDFSLRETQNKYFQEFNKNQNQIPH